MSLRDDIVLSDFGESNYLAVWRLLFCLHQKLREIKHENNRVSLQPAIQAVCQTAQCLWYLCSHVKLGVNFFRFSSLVTRVSFTVTSNF